jgi:hypothetical protein
MATETKKTKNTKKGTATATATASKQSIRNHDAQQQQST